MITKIIDENSVSCIPEDSDDLIILRRVIKKGDKIIGETVRVVKPVSYTHLTLPTILLV